jgi:hypothetical protein
MANSLAESVEGALRMVTLWKCAACALIMFGALAWGPVAAAADAAAEPVLLIRPLPKPADAPRAVLQVPARGGDPAAASGSAVPLPSARVLPGSASGERRAAPKPGEWKASIDPSISLDGLRNHNLPAMAEIADLFDPFGIESLLVRMTRHF